MSTRLHLFGSPAIATLAGDTPIPATRQMQLLAYLAARRNWQRRDDVAALFWPDRANKEARSNLRNLIHKTQAYAPFASMELTDHAMRVNVPSDVIDFEAAIDASEWESAVRLGSSELLQGFESEVTEPYLAWLVNEREAILANWKNAVQALIEVTSTPVSQRLALALIWANRCPYDEDAVRAQVAIELEMQHQGAAARIYRAFEQRLKQEFGVAPSQQLRQIAAVTASPTSGLGQAALAQLRRPSEYKSEPIFGRKIELQRLKSLLADPAVRLVTLSGPGGVGKSTLLKALFVQIAAVDQTEVHLVDASSLHSAQAIIPAIASALGVEGREAASAEAALASQLRSRPCLLLIDGAEQTGIELELDSLLNKCPQLRLVIATRHHLNIAGEHLLVLDGFLLPDADETEPEVLTTNDGVRFVIDAMKRAGQMIDVPRDATTIAALVRLVEGLPLALSLLVNLTRIFPLPTLLDNVRNSVAGKAQSGAPGIGGLMPALSASFDRSWGALSAAEQSALGRLAVFPATFDAAAACSVAATELPVIMSLADKSLVRAAGDGRLSLHAAIRACVHVASPAHEDTDAAFIGHYERSLKALADLAIRKSSGPFKGYLRDEWINVQHTWHAALDRRAYSALLSLAESLLWQADSIDPSRDSGALFVDAERTLRGAPHMPLALNAVLLAGIARATLNRRNIAAAVENARAALHEAVRAKHRDAMYAAMDVLANGFLYLGKLHEADAMVVRAMAMCSGLDEERYRMRFKNHRAILSCLNGDLETALALFDEVVANHLHFDNVVGAVRAIMNQAWCCSYAKEQSRALKCLDEAIRVAKAGGVDRAFEVSALSDASDIHFGLGDVAQARAYISRANAVASYGSQTSVQQAWLQIRNAQIELSERNATAAAPRLADVLRTIADGDSVPLIGPAFLLVAKWHQCVGNQTACRQMLRHVTVQTYDKATHAAALKLLQELGDETVIGATAPDAEPNPTQIAKAAMEEITAYRSRSL